MASATLLISVDGVVDPPDSSVNILPSDIVIIDIWSDGQTKAGPKFLTIEGPGTLDWSGAIRNYEVNDDPPGPYQDSIPGDPGVFVALGPRLLIDLALPTPGATVPEGTVIDLIEMHCDGLEDVILTLWDTDETTILDTQVIHQPEPMTIALLGLGGLFLVRRKRR
jgi:hypothetical protein